MCASPAFVVGLVRLVGVGTALGSVGMWRERAGLLTGAISDMARDRLVPVRDVPTRLTILTFHRIESLDELVEDLGRLRQVSTPVSLDQVLAANAGGDPLPKNAILVTLDDGHHSVVDGGPIFAELAVPAVCFIVSSLIDSSTPFWWDEVAGLTDRGARSEACPQLAGLDLVNYLKQQPDEQRRAVLAELRTQVNVPIEARLMTSTEVRQLVGFGIDMGGHSVTHPLLTQCTDEVLRQEVTDCRAELTALLGTTPRSFAYPGGQVNDRVEAATRDAGWEVAFAWDHAMSPFPFPNPHRISRVKAGMGSGRSRLALLATGRHPSLPPLGGPVR